MSIYSPSFSSFTNPYKFHVWRNSAYNTGGTAYLKLPFDSKAFDTGGNVDVTVNIGRFTAPVAGFYWFSANLDATPPVTNDELVYESNFFGFDSD